MCIRDRVKRIQSQERSLAKAIYEEQVAMGWPGLAREVKEICKAVGMEDINEKSLTKDEVDEAIFYADQKELKEDMERYEKLKGVKNEDFRKEQEYLNEKGVVRARMAFRIRSRMVNKVKCNFKSMNRGNLKCDMCDMEEDETQEHIVVCPGWKEELGSLDVSVMRDLTEFFMRVMRRKEK